MRRANLQHAGTTFPEQAQDKKVLLVIPVFNEELELVGSVERLIQFLSDGYPFETEIVIADNGSNDGTLALARNLQERYRQVTAVHLEQKGRGGALKKVWSEGNADIFAYMDVDLSTDLAAFPRLVGALACGEYDIAIGSRLMVGSRTVREWKRELISRGYNRLIQFLFRTGFSDAQCGFKGITRHAARQLLPVIEDSGWFFDSELLLVAEKCGYRILDLPVQWTSNPGSQVKILSTICCDLLGLARVRRNLRRNAYSHLIAPKSDESLNRKNRRYHFCDD